MHKIKLILLLILPLSVLGQDLGIIDTKTTKNPAINGTHRISTDGKNLFFRNFFGLSKKVASTDSAVFTGTTVLPSNTTIGNVSATELGYLDGVTSPIQAQINSIGGNKVFYGTVDITNAVSLTANVGDLYINTTSKAVYKKTNLSFPTGLTYIALASGTWVKLGNFSLTKSDVGLSDVDNTSDANKPISSATQTALNGKENTLTKGNITSTDLTITGGTSSIIGTGVTISLSSLGRIRHFSGAGDVTNAISLTANIGDIYFNTTNGTVYQKSNLSFPSGLTYITLASGTWVKLGDYTLDKSKVGLSNVDNTSDANKPISSATQTALDLKANITSPTFITDATTPRLKITGAGDIGKGSDLVMAGNSNDLTMHGTGKVILGTGGFQRLVVTNAGNVGVGTTAPVAKFEVSGLAGFRYNDGKQADGKYLRSNSTGVAAWDSVKVSEVFGLNTTYLPINNPTSTGTLTAPTIANSLGANFATTSGNVGIGTTTPVAKLEISGAGVVSSQITSTNSTAQLVTSGTVGQIYNTTGDLYLTNASTTNSTLFVNNGAERMRIFSNGRVGIGTTTDAGYLLDVNGNARFSNSSSTGGIEIGQTGFTAKLQYNTNGNLDITPRTGYNTIFTAGNVGIGTTTPTSKLHIEGDNSSTTDETVLTLRGNGENGKRIDFRNAFGSLSRITGTKLASGASADDGILTFETSTNSILSEKMRITDLGNVGIGTASPLTKFHIKRTGVNGAGLASSAIIATDGKTIGDGIGLDFFGHDSGNNEQGYGSFRYTITNPTAGAEASELSITTWNAGANTERIKISSTGNVGIGTSTPNASSVLDITSTTQGVLFPRMTTAEISAIASPADGLTVYNTTLKAICFYDSSAAVWKKVSHLR